MGVLSNNLIAPLAGASIVIFAPSYQGLPTPDATLRTLRAAKANFVWVVPVFLELWAASDEAVDYLKSAAMVVRASARALHAQSSLTRPPQGFGGGPLSDELGDNLVARGVKLTSMYGGTEMNAMCQCLPVGPQEWAWLRFSDAAKPRWIDQGDGTYELQFLVRSLFL
jgi:acyl-coenzyme A synthetase/AMP-(fatty) acid ligase